MKKKALTLLASLLLVGSAGAVLALPGLQTVKPTVQETLDEATSTSAVESPTALATLQRAAKGNQAISGELAARPFDPQDAQLVTNPVIQAKETKTSPILNKMKGRSVSSIADLTGQYVMLYASLTSTVGDGGISVNISALGTDSINIANFWIDGLNVHAKVNVATGAVSIPAQYLYNHNTHGAVWLAVCSSDGKPDYTKEIAGTVNANGTISLSSWWGTFVKEGTNAGSFFLAAYDTAFGRANAKMDCDVFQGGSDSYGVLVSQPYDNQINVLNFGNNGMSVTIDLKRDGSSSIKSQVVREYPANADFYTYAATGFKVSSTGGVSFEGLSTTIYPDTVATKTTNTLQWNKWTALSRGSSKTYLLGLWDTGKITANSPISFPQLAVTTLTGSGTETDPFQIKTKDDLVLLSQMVDESTDTIHVSATSYYICAFRDKHFKVMNDIDMSGTNFQSIGAGFKRFGGHFDGNNKKISNLYVNITGNYAGLFGTVDTIGSLKNVTMVNPKIECSGNYGASLAAWSYAPVENCHVTGGSVIVTGQVSGGLVGASSGGMKNCSASGIQVIGTGGWCGGLLGQATVYLTDCSATGVYVSGFPGSGTSMGGLAGMILCDASNLQFAGTSDGYRLGGTDEAGIINGSLCGVLSGGKISNSVATGTVLGRGTKCEIGGLVGRAQNATIENSSFHGRIGSFYSRTTGGLVGRVIGLTNDGKPATNTFKNLYTASYVRLEDYQYDRETGWAETLGQVDTNGTLVTDNVCYDSQMFSEKSANGTPLTTAQLTSGTPLPGFSTDVWNFTAGQYPTLKSAGSSVASDLAASALLITGNNSLAKITRDTKLSPVGATKFYLVINGKASLTGHHSKIVGNDLKISSFGPDTLIFANGNTNFWLPFDVAPIPFEGDGTEASPYLIKTKADIMALAGFCNDNQQYFPETHFLQANDIDMENDPAFPGIAAVSSDAHSRFAGIYDGGGHTIHRLKLPGLVWKTAPSGTTLGTPETGTNGSEGYKGFIGRLDVDGVVRNLNFAADCDASETWATVGLAVGDNYGLIQNVRNYADITAVSCWVGGIAGTNEVEGRIIDCYNAGNVISGYNCAGGISGRNNGLIENCANAGDVAVKKIANFGRNYNVAGGITTNMSNGIVKNVLNVGKVEASQTAGGIVASLVASSVSGNGPGKNDIIGAVTYASVVCPDVATSGIVAGFAPSNKRADGTVLAYYDDQIANCKAYGNSGWEGMNGLSTTEMTSGTALQGLDDNWQFDKGMYPVLKKFADEPKLIAARKVILTLPAGVTVRDVTQNGTLSSGATWAVDPATYFSVSGSTLNTGAAPEAVQNAVLTGSLDGFTKPIYLTRIPPVPLTGEGTEASPYMIMNATDWNNLAAYINSTHEKFEGKYIKIGADFSFDDTTTFMPLFASDADELLGTLDGGSHTVSGVAMTTTATYQAPIRTVGATGVLKNLTLQGKVTSAKSSCGAFTARVYGKIQNCVNEVELLLTAGNAVGAFGQAYANAVFENCVNKAHLKTMTTMIGGLVHTAEANVSFTDCGNTGIIESGFTGSAPSTGQSIGGLVGNATSVKMTRCYNKGSFKFAKTANMYGVGGLIGWAKSVSANTDSLVLDGCYNEVSFEAGYMVAGLVANVDYSTTAPNKIVVRNCHNSGNITQSANTSSKTNAVAAGIIALYAPGTVIENCYNIGEIKNLNTKSAYAAGIAAYYKTAPTAALPLTLKNCHNTGNISAKYNYAGGIFGIISGVASVSDCYNTGAVSATIGAGGIVGNYSNAASTLERCWNSGDITVSESRAGGIAGQNTVKSTMRDCFNMGNVTNSAATVTATANGRLSKGYGTGGVVGEGGGNMSRCYNMGTVKGIANVGGLVGRTHTSATVISSCYNAGKIDAPADSCGYLVGNAIENNGLLWKDAANGGSNSISDCYYYVVPAEEGTATVEEVSMANNAGTALTEAELCALDMGEGWTNVDYTFPLLTDLSTDLAKVWAARIILDPRDTSNVITHNFFGGMPEGLVWTSSIPTILSTASNPFTWQTTFTGQFTMTATCGDASRTVSLQGKETTGVSDLDAGHGEIVSETYYTSAGLEVAKPKADGQVYIVIRKYSDGTSTTSRFVAK